MQTSANLLQFQNTDFYGSGGLARISGGDQRMEYGGERIGVYFFVTLKFTKEKEVFMQSTDMSWKLPVHVA